MINGLSDCISALSPIQFDELPGLHNLIANFHAAGAPGFPRKCPFGGNHLPGGVMFGRFHAIGNDIGRDPSPQFQRTGPGLVQIVPFAASLTHPRCHIPSLTARATPSHLLRPAAWPERPASAAPA